MNIAKMEQKENPLLSRKELVLTIEFDQTTPSRQAIAQSVKDKVGCDEKLVVVKKIENKYGLHQALVQAYVYKDEKSLLVEPRYVGIRGLDKEKKKEAREKIKAEKKKKKQPAKK